MKKLPIGISDFKKIIEGDFFYIDKTLLIDDLWKASGEVILMPRPRRFGKTLNLSMLRYFFEKNHSTHDYLFHKTNIWQIKEYQALQGTFPVLYLTFKDIKEGTWEAAYEKFAIFIAEEFNRHRYLLDILQPHEKKDYLKILHKEASQADLETSLKFLTHLLYTYYKNEVIVLIDEYDTPIHAAHLGDYYEKTVDFMRSLLSGCLKDNPVLKRGFLTGILRTAREGIFSGLNNLMVYSLLSDKASDKFGFVAEDVDILLQEMNLSEHARAIKEWYNGYRCGERFLYNPWSLLQCVENNGSLIPYWVNTSDNALVQKLITDSDSEVKKDLEKLLSNIAVDKEINEAFVFSDVLLDSRVLWSLLLFTGYVTYKNKEIIEGKIICSLTLPNKEVHLLYSDLIKSIFVSILSKSKIFPLTNALITGNVEIFSALFQEFIMKAMSTFDIYDSEPEKSYHLFALGLLVMLEDSYEVKSNDETGFGRSDIILIPKDQQKSGAIIEFKKATSMEDKQLESAALKALKQIEEKQYSQNMQISDIKHIIKYGIGIKGKKIAIKMAIQ